MYLFIIASGVSIYLLTKHLISWTPNMCIDKSTQTELIDLYSPVSSEYSDPFDIDLDFFKYNR